MAFSDALRLRKRCSETSILLIWPKLNTAFLNDTQKQTDRVDLSKKREDGDQEKVESAN